MAMKILKNVHQAFQFLPFSIKQKMVLTWWANASPYRDYDCIVADGAVRSGKTLSMALSFVMWGMATHDGKNLALCGKTIGALRRNVVNDLKRMLKGRGYRVEDYRTDNLVMVSKGGKINAFYLFGGKDESSQDLIQGITLAGVFFDEVALMPESFVTQATLRCSVKGAKFWFNCNPEGPYHWFKVNWIDSADVKRVLYIHFDMDDNLSLDDDTKARYRRMYVGIFYKRFILGLWVLAEGAIFDMFDEARNVCHDVTPLRDYERVYIAVDYGIQNPMTYGKYGVAKGKYHLIDRYYHCGRDSGKQKTDQIYADDLIAFIGDDPIKSIIVDPSASSFMAELRSRQTLKDKGIRIIPAKNDVIKGIQAVSVKLYMGDFTIEPHCTEDCKEFSSYVWDKKAVAKGKDEPLKENDHCMDRNRYAILTDMLLFSKRVNISGKGMR